MKKILYLTGIFAIAALTSGCQKEDVSKVEAESNLVEVTFTTAKQSFTPDTKTHLGTEADGVVPVLWDYDDEIATGQGAEFYTLGNQLEAGPTAEFKGMMDRTKLIFSNDYYAMAIYPASSLHPITATGSEGVYFQNSSGKPTTRNGVIYKTEQTLTPGSFDKTANISAAVFDAENDTELYFHNLTSLLAMRLTGNAKIKSIEITIQGTRFLSGVMGIQNYSDKKKGTGKGKDARFSFFKSKNNSTSPKVVLNATDEVNGIDITGGVSFYACIIPAAINSDIYMNGVGTVGIQANDVLTIRFTDVNDKYIEKNITVNTTVGKGEIYVLGNWTNVNTDKFTTPVE